jgi:SRSO17 transposase
MTMSAPRSARPTIGFVDQYCQLYGDLLPEVRSFEAFKLLHLGMISEIKRKTLPAIAEPWVSTIPKTCITF